MSAGRWAGFQPDRECSRTSIAPPATVAVAPEDAGDSNAVDRIRTGTRRSGSLPPVASRAATGRVHIRSRTCCSRPCSQQDAWDRIRTGGRNARSLRSLRVPSRAQIRRRLLSLAGVLATAMRGTGFEPADLYRTAPSTLRRWPSLATHARSSRGKNCSVAFRFNPFRSLPTSLPSRGPRLVARGPYPLENPIHRPIARDRATGPAAHPTCHLGREPSERSRRPFGTGG